jgi:type I restriction enzyme M protein
VIGRISRNLIGIRGAKTTSATIVYDPTCGLGSLLLKVGDEAGTAATLYGWEKDAATSGLARMNMILPDNPTALIVPGNALEDPKFKDERHSRPWGRTHDCPVLLNGLPAPLIYSENKKI